MIFQVFMLSCSGCSVAPCRATICGAVGKVERDSMLFGRGVRRARRYRSMAPVILYLQVVLSRRPINETRLLLRSVCVCHLLTAVL